MIRSGSFVWLAHHELRLSWRDWLGLITGGRPPRGRGGARRARDCRLHASARYA